MRCRGLGSGLYFGDALVKKIQLAQLFHRFDQFVFFCKGLTQVCMNCKYPQTESIEFSTDRSGFLL